MTKPIRQKITISLFIMLLAASGCSNQDTSSAPKHSNQQIIQDIAIKEQAVMDNFNALLQKKDVSVSEIIKYIDENIVSVSQSNASAMVIWLDKVQQDKLPKMQDQFGDSEAVQKALTNIYKNGLTNQAISSIENKEAKDLLLSAQNYGFKIETAEGMYFPVIDYSAYKKYRNAVTQDIAAFIDIMATESDKTPIKDAALTISWDEVVKRAMKQEQFIKNYSNSAKVEEVRQLLKRYMAFALYGANNTPLFGYDAKQMALDAKKTYLETAFDANNGIFSKVMNGYLAILKKNDYKLTAEVQEHRSKAAEEVR